MSAEELPPRESMEFDVVIVGAGPSGLAAAIRLKQLNAESQHRRGGEGFRGRRAYPVGRRDRSGRARRADPGLARGCGLPAQDAGQGRPLLLDHRDQRDPAAELPHAAADGQSCMLYRLARRCLPLAGRRRRKRSASKSIRALPRPKCCTTTAARSAASRPATWASAGTASPRIPSRAAWNCSASTRCSPKARAAA